MNEQELMESALEAFAGFRDGSGSNAELSALQALWIEKIQGHYRANSLFADCETGKDYAHAIATVIAWASLTEARDLIDEFAIAPIKACRDSEKVGMIADSVRKYASNSDCTKNAESLRSLLDYTVGRLLS